MKETSSQNIASLVQPRDAALAPESQGERPKNMRLAEQVRNSVLVALLIGTLHLCAQSVPRPLPSTAPTNTVPKNTAQIATAAQPPSVLPPRVGNATVIWEKGLLRVEARNSSLNGILRDISLRTGLKIVGGVQEDRVFGTYGPAPAATVLQQLLDGTKTNMLLQSDSAMLPVLLTLTPQTGHATPPSPMAAREEAPDDDNRVFSPNGPPPAETRARDFVPLGAPASGETPTPAAATDQPAPDDQNGNGARTPQQIMEQLQRLRAQQQPQTQ